MRAFINIGKVSEAKARTRLDEFINTSVDAYAVDRDRPDLTGTSSLSPYLRWGQISPMQIAQALSERCELSDKGPMVYLKEIYWRGVCLLCDLSFFRTRVKIHYKKSTQNFPGNRIKKCLLIGSGVARVIRLSMRGCNSTRRAGCIIGYA